ncbi:flagellar motor protein MotB [Sphingosinicella sp. BN140058]|uniref:flagellar motor protein MotB n=1 Tax=Sphingosinicella sp. BN140058 TaxID=1892855 RepID=UPI0010133065|nr:flagellar motor protein MotB [Sphingosinicella sp. BN140058]QAY76614.1 flagellar motor protein MotB [Sphingosinicella sp. BN140058]
MASRRNEPVIVIRKVKKSGGDAHHGGAWKVAYADFVTAMMAFFMLLWLLSTPDKDKLKGLAEYFTPEDPSATGTTGDAGGGGRSQRSQAESQDTNGKPTVEVATAGTARGGSANVPDSSMRVIAAELRVVLDSIPAKDAKDAVKLETSRDGLRINLTDTANRPMFKGATAVLNDYAREMLGQIARRLVKSGARIAIEGHTDSIGGQSDSNWRLSGDRAQAARSAMIAAGLTPDRFSEVVALAGSQPIYADQPDRPENRRITIVVMAEAPALPQDVNFQF